MMGIADRPRILCVDDEPGVLEGLALHLRRRYVVQTADSGAAALAILQQGGETAVIISDMRMPGMDGATFLKRSRDMAPDAARILLTGQTDLDSAIAAVNQGQIFRFLAKPCPPSSLLSAVEAGTEQHRLITAERVLLEQTLRGSIKTLTDVLAIASPVSFGRAIRIKHIVLDLAHTLEMPEHWEIDVAAMLSQLGCITLPPETLEKFYYGLPLLEYEEEMVGRMRTVTEQLLGSIPRLEVVRGILAGYDKPYRRFDPERRDAEEALVWRGAQLLKVADDFDRLGAQGHLALRALEIMRGHGDRYDPAVLGALETLCGSEGNRDEIRELTLAAIQVGMIFADDVKLLETGILFVARGYEVTEGFIERARNFRRGTIEEPLRVMVRKARTGQEVIS